MWVNYFFHTFHPRRHLKNHPSVALHPHVLRSGFSHRLKTVCRGPECKKLSSAWNRLTFGNSSAKLSPDRIHPTSLLSLFSNTSRITAVSIISLFSTVTVDMHSTTVKRLRDSVSTMKATSVHSAALRSQHRTRSKSTALAKAYNSAPSTLQRMQCDLHDETYTAFAIAKSSFSRIIYPSCVLWSVLFANDTFA